MIIRRVMVEKMARRVEAKAARRGVVIMDYMLIGKSEEGIRKAFGVIRLHHNCNYSWRAFPRL